MGMKTGKMFSGIDRSTFKGSNGWCWVHCGVVIVRPAAQGPTQVTARLLTGRENSQHTGISSASNTNTRRITSQSASWMESAIWKILAGYPYPTGIPKPIITSRLPGERSGGYCRRNDSKWDHQTSNEFFNMKTSIRMCCSKQRMVELRDNWTE